MDIGCRTYFDVPFGASLGQIRLRLGDSGGLEYLKFDSSPLDFD